MAGESGAMAGIVRGVVHGRYRCETDQEQQRAAEQHSTQRGAAMRSGNASSVRGRVSSSVCGSSRLSGHTSLHSSLLLAMQVLPMQSSCDAAWYLQ